MASTFIIFYFISMSSIANSVGHLPSRVDQSLPICSPSSPNISNASIWVQMAPQNEYTYIQYHHPIPRFLGIIVWHTHTHIYIYIQSVASICIASTFWHTSPPAQPCSSGLPVQIWTYAPPPFPEAVDVGPSWIKQRMSKIVCFATGTNWQSSNLLEKTWLICLGVQARPQNAWKLRLICLGEILGNPILALFREISTSLDQQR